MLIVSNWRQRKAAELATPAKLNAPVKFTAPEKLELTIIGYRLQNRSLTDQLVEMRNEIKNHYLPVTNGCNKDFISIMSNADKSKMPNFMKLLWEEHQNYQHATKTGVRYHTMAIKYCLGLAAKSPAAYDHFRYEEKNQTGFLILPSRRRLRDY